MTLPAQLTDIVYDPSWHKAVFYREPLVRFLSAFRSKCEPGHDVAEALCELTFGSPRPTFEQAVERLRRLPPPRNQHWRPQADFCGGLSTILPLFQTVEALDVITSRDRVIRMLNAVGVDAHNIPAFHDLFPVAAMGVEQWRPSGEHITNVDDVVDAYYTSPYLVCVVMKYFLDDYLLFGLTVPPWVRKRWDFHLDRWVTTDCASLKQ